MTTTTAPHSAQRDEYRLTEADEFRIRSVIRDTIESWRRELDGYPQLDRHPDTLSALRFKACRQIGVFPIDLRGSELTWIESQVTTELDRQPVGRRG